MSDDRSREAFGRFLDFLGEKGLVSPATAKARRISSLQLLSILDEGEAADVTKIDIDEVVRRFTNLHGQDYTPDSLVTYRSRLRSSMNDFRSYLENPLSFKPGVQSRGRPQKAKGQGADPYKEVRSRVQNEPQRPVAAPVMAGSNVMPIPIRADLTILIHGLPHDLTEGEAKRISGVITAMAIAT